MTNLKMLYKEWRETSEDMLADGFKGSIDSGEGSAREDFTNFAELENEISFEDMFELEKEYEQEENIMYTLEFQIVGEDWQVLSNFKTLEEANKELEHQIKYTTDAENDEGDRLAIFLEDKIVEEFVFDGNVYI